MPLLPTRFTPDHATSGPAPIGAIGGRWPSLRDRGVGLGRRLSVPVGMAAYGLFYAILFGAVVILPLAVVIFGLVVMFG